MDKVAHMDFYVNYRLWNDKVTKALNASQINFSVVEPGLQPTAHFLPVLGFNDCISFCRLIKN
jgi:hypothetical protein